MYLRMESLLKLMVGTCTMTRPTANVNMQYF